MPDRFLATHDTKAASRVVLRRFMTLEGARLDRLVWRNEAPSSAM